MAHIEAGLAAVANGGSLPAMKIRGTTAWPVGDSITIRGGVTSPLQFQDNQWCAWMSMFSNQRLRVLGLSATSGYSTADVLAFSLPTALASSADIIPVLCGRNDAAGSYSGGSTPFVLATTIANLTSIYQQIIGAGKLPVAMTVIPDGSYVTNIDRINKWMFRYAQANRIPFVDLYSSMVNTATGALLAAYDGGDTVHPNAIGAKTMGRLVAEGLAPITHPWRPFLASQNADPDVMVTNPLLLTDTNTDGIPDNWSVSGGGTPVYSLAAMPNLAAAGGALPGTPVTVTFQNQYGKRDMPLMTAVNNLTGGSSPAVAVTTSTQGSANADAVQTITITGTPTGGNFNLVVTDPVTGNVFTTGNIAYNASAASVLAALKALSNKMGDGTVIGNAWKITRGSADLLIFTSGIAVAAGATIGVGLRAKAELQGYGGGVTIKAVGTLLGNTQFGLVGAGGVNWLRDFDWTDLYGEFVVPSNDTGFRLQIILAATGPASVTIAQPTFVNLTSKAIL